MKKVIRLVSVFSWFFLISQSIYAQKKPYLTEQPVILKTAAEYYEKSMQPGGELYEFKNNYAIQGSYEFDLVLRKKGEVATIRIVNRNGGSVSMQNQVKDYIRLIKLPMKLPKDKSYKLRYTFNF